MRERFLVNRRVGFLGPNASFTDLAASKLFRLDERIPYKTIPAVIDAVKKRKVDLCIVPLENAIEGSVNLTLDYIIHETALKIVGEIVLPIQQHLMVHQENISNIETIKKVVSHPHALAQCHQFLHNHFSWAESEEMSSTSAAAKFVSEHPDDKIAAIANYLAAEKYDLTIVKKNVHDFPNNHTRFVVLTSDASYEMDEYDGYKSTLMVTLPTDQAGTLHQVLSAFAWRKLNLSKIESRPMKTGLGHYFFIIDIEMKYDEVLIPGAIAELEALGCSVKVLGSYPYYDKRHD